MATPIKNNLPPASQQWVRDIEQRMTDLERQNQLLQITANKNAVGIGAVQSATAAGSPIVASQSRSIVTSGTGDHPIDLPLQVTFNLDSRLSLIHVNLYTYGLGSPTGTTNSNHYVEITGSTLGKILPDVPGQGAMRDSSYPTVSVANLHTELLLSTDYYCLVEIPEGEIITVTGYNGTSTSNPTHNPYQVGGTSVLTCGSAITIYPSIKEPN